MGTTKPEGPRSVRPGERAVLRNLLVTQGYHELSRDFACMLGPENVTWFSFASWSSKSVGGFLQNEQLTGRLLDQFEQEGASRSRLIAAVGDVRRYVSLGNTEVYGELAPAFRRFLDWFGADQVPDPAKLERFVATLVDGPSQPDHVATNPHTRELELIARGGQSPLREAARQLYEARFERDAKRRAEHVLLANAHIGVHEQTRLQTYIAGALDAPLRTLAGRSGFPPPPTLGDAPRDVPWLLGHVNALFRRFATDRLLTLKLPDSSLRLGRDLHAAPGQPLFPQMLEHIDHPELGAMFARYVRPVYCGLLVRARTPHRRESSAPAAFSPIPSLRVRSAVHVEVSACPTEAPLLRCACGEGRLEARPPVNAVCPKTPARLHRADGSGAEDWTSLDQRMRFILQLFRSRQRNQRLLEPTFSVAQVAAIRRGRIPHGPLS